MQESSRKAKMAFKRALQICILKWNFKIALHSRIPKDSDPATMLQHESYHANPAPEGQLSYELCSSRTVIMQNLSQHESYHANCSCKLWSNRKVIMQTLAQQDSYHANCGPPGKLSCKLRPSRTVIMQTVVLLRCSTRKNLQWCNTRDLLGCNTRGLIT